MHAMLWMHCPSSSSTFRSIRQHAKFSVDREWSSISTYYAQNGLYPVTAMNYNTHICHWNKSAATTYSLASFSIQCIARGTACQDDIDAMLHLVLQDQRVQRWSRLTNPSFPSSKTWPLSWQHTRMMHQHTYWKTLHYWWHWKKTPFSATRSHSTSQ